MKTVLLVSSKVFHYRVSVYNYLWARFREAGYDFQVASDELQGENRQALKFAFHRTPQRFAAYRRLIRDVDPSVVLFHLRLKDRLLWTLMHWLKLRRVPVICWTKGANLDKPDSRLHRLLYNYFHALSTALILYSPNEIRFVLPRLRDKIFVANNTINFNDFPDIPDEVEAIKQEFDLPFRRLVLFAGTMGVGGERKKVRHIIDVFRELDRNDVGLVLVGGGMSEALRARLNPANTRYLGQVHDPGHVQISKLFKASDLFVVPGHVGLGINQAFYWGLPVITEAGRQPPEIQYLADGRNGYIVPEDDRDALRDRMLFLLDNDDVRGEFARRAREDIMEKADIADMYACFLAAVRFAEGGGAQKACARPARAREATK